MTIPLEYSISICVLKELLQEGIINEEQYQIGKEELEKIYLTEAI